MSACSADSCYFLSLQKTKTKPCIFQEQKERKENKIKILQLTQVPGEVGTSSSSLLPVRHTACPPASDIHPCALLRTWNTCVPLPVNQQEDTGVENNRTKRERLKEEKRMQNSGDTKDVWQYREEGKDQDGLERHKIECNALYQEKEEGVTIIREAYRGTYSAAMETESVLWGTERKREHTVNRNKGEQREGYREVLREEQQ